MMLMPADTCPGAEGLGNLVRIFHHGGHDMKRGGQVWRPVFTGKNERVFGNEIVGLALIVVTDVSGGGLACEPFADEALVRADQLCEFGRSHGAGISHGSV